MINKDQDTSSENGSQNLQPTKKDLIEKIAELEKQLEVSKSRLNELEDFCSERLDNLNDVLFSVNAEGYFTYLNPAIKNITGYNIQEVIGTHFTKHVHPDDIPGLVEDIEKTVKGDHNPYMFRIVKKDGSISYVHTTSRPILKNGEFKGINGLMVDIAKLKNMEYKLKKERDRAQKYLDIVGVIILVTDRQGNIELINKAGCQLFGCSESSLVSRNWFDISSPEDEKEKIKKNYEKVMQGRSHLLPYYENSVQIKGENRIFGWHSILLEDEHGNITGVLSSGEDITDRKNVEKALVFAKLITENANRTKRQFLSNISHELRTPLNLIIGYSDLLHEDHVGKTNDQQKQYLEVIQRSGNRLLLLINSMIELSAIEEGKVELSIKEFSIPAIIKDIKNTTLPMASKKQIKLDFVLDERLKTIRADKDKFKTVLYNLINNAIKFTPEYGDIKVSISTENKMLKVSVEDTGIGIEEKNIDKLFHPFSQLDSALNRRYEGAGLGLMIVKEFVEMHGGKIIVESEVGIGSNFAFVMPMEPKQKID